MKQQHENSEVTAVQSEKRPPVHLKSGGLYRNVRVPVGLLNGAIAVGLLCLVFAVVFLSAKGSFTVTFDAQGGEGVPPAQVRFGQTVEEPDTPHRTGYTFVGWYQDKDCTKRWNFPTNRAEQSLTLYAKWQVTALSDG